MTLQDAIELRDAAKAAYLNALKQGQSYSISAGYAPRSKTNYNLDALRVEYEKAERLVEELSGASRSRVHRVV